MILAIDIGNTRIKAAVFEDDNLQSKFVFQKDQFRKKIENILDDYPQITHLVVASVGNVEKEEFFYFENRVIIKMISNRDLFPFNNLYKTPLTLGIDRMVLASGAVVLFPKQNRLVIDAGTCVTYDFVDEYDNYQGGAIAPGLRLRYESLHNFTANLPLLSFENPDYLVGKSTDESIHSGVVNGFVFEIEGFIQEYLNRYSNVAIILTGGDAEFLATRLKNTIFANSNFLLESLNHIFQFQIKK